MRRKLTDSQKIGSEAEEGDWYATPLGRRQTQREFARALKDGTLIRTNGSKIAKTDPKVLEQLIEQASRTPLEPSRFASRSPISNRPNGSPRRLVSATKPCSSKLFARA